MEEGTAQNKKLIGIEVKTSGMIAVCIDKNGKLIDSYKISLEKNEDTAVPLANFIKDLQARFGDFDKVGITVPGLLNKETGRIVYSTRNPEHAEVDLLSELEKVTKLKVFIENDANAAAYGEYVLGAGHGNKDMFYVTLGTGIGGALIFSHKLWHGVSGFAGEFGHVAINSEGEKLEDVASSANILRRVKKWFHKDATSSLNAIGEENITITDLVNAANEEDDFAMLMLQRTGTYIGVAVAGVINLLNIEKIVIGGEIMTAGDIVLDAIAERAKELSFAPSFEAVDIVKGKLGENASAIGVALLSDVAS